MTQTSTPASPVDQREVILARSAELFASRGYPSTTMNEVAEASLLSKATLYHYFSEKSELLLNITDGHVSRLVAVVEEVDRRSLAPPVRLRALITGFMQEYASAHHAHRVLTEDVRFLNPEARQLVLDKERRVVNAFARAIAAVRPEIEVANLSKPLTMLLFGMLNWMFTWLRPDGRLTYAEMAPIVTDLFFGGLEAVQVQMQRDSTPT